MFDGGGADCLLFALRPFTGVDLKDRQWPSKRITKAPRWASSDLRDGNQALVNPMTIDQKDRFFKLLLKCGFKEIEAGFPSAGETEFGFIRKLIEKDESPDDVWLQVSSILQILRGLVVV